MDKITNLGTLTAYVWNDGKDYCLKRDLTGSDYGSGFRPDGDAVEYLKRTNSALKSVVFTTRNPN